MLMKADLLGSWCHALSVCICREGMPAGRLGLVLRALAGALPSAAAVLRVAPASPAAVVAAAARRV
ncbi:MAG: hypothetical protein ACI4XG_25865, partial [Bradyrhizobium sp.]